MLVIRTQIGKHWVIQCDFFMIITSLFAMIICDLWLEHTNIIAIHEIHPYNDMSILMFASILAKDSLEND